LPLSYSSKPDSHSYGYGARTGQTEDVYLSLVAEPDILPHPDDVVFDYVNRELRIVGPTSAAEAKDVQERKELADVMYEMSLFLEEWDFGKPTDDDPVYGKSLYFYLLITATLPPRLRKFDDDLHEAIVRRTFGQRANWAGFLNQRFKELGKETDVNKVRTQPIDLRDLGMRLGPHGLGEYRWPKRKRATGSRVMALLEHVHHLT
jgi:hypothetical protein